MKRSLRWLSGVAFTLLFSGGASAQNTPKQQEFIQNYSRMYMQSAFGNSTLYVGRIQEPIHLNLESVYISDRYNKKFDGWGMPAQPAPVIISESYGKGNLFYDGVLYADLLLRLDLCRDELVVQLPQGVQGIVLDPEKVEWADFFGYRVIYVRKNDPEFNLPQGYYLELHSGEHRVLKKETLLFNVTNLNFVNWSSRYYIENNGVFHRVKPAKSSLLRVMKDQKRELGKFINPEKENLKTHPESTIVLIVKEYERLEHQ